MPTAEGVTVAIRRGVGLVVGLLVVAVLISATGMALIWAVAAREPAVAPQLDARAAARHRSSARRRRTTSCACSPDPRPASLGNVLEALRKAKVDPRIGAVLVVPSRLQAPLWAKVQEVRAGILDFRTSGKPAYAFLEYADDRGYYLASACSRIVLMPSSQLALNGLASYSVFLRGTFDKLDAFPDFLHVGTVQDRGKPVHRERLHSRRPRDERGAQHRSVRSAGAGHRGGPQEDGSRGPRADRRGPVPAADALKAGLVDDLAYADQIDDKLRMPGGKLRELNLRDYTRVSAPRSV